MEEHSKIINQEKTHVNENSFSESNFILKYYYVRQRCAANRVQRSGEQDHIHKETAETTDTIRNSLEDCYTFNSGIKIKCLDLSFGASQKTINEYITTQRQMIESEYSFHLLGGQQWKLWVEETVFVFMKHKHYMDKRSRIKYYTENPIETKQIVLRTGKDTVEIL